MWLWRIVCVHTDWYLLMNVTLTPGDRFVESLLRQPDPIIEAMPDDSLRDEFRLTLADYRTIARPTDEDIERVESLCRTAESWLEDE